MTALIIAFLVVFAIGPVEAWAGPRAVVEHLSLLGSRVAGYPGSVQAAEYVEGQLQALGLMTRRDSFAVVVPIDKGGRLEWEGESAACTRCGRMERRLRLCRPRGCGHRRFGVAMEIGAISTGKRWLGG